MEVQQQEKYPDHYKNYVGQYVKRFYAPFDKEYMYKIVDFKLAECKTLEGLVIYWPEYMYESSDGTRYWYDCEDSCIITNELPIKKIDWVANVADPEYHGYNPFTGKIIEKNAS